jgi:hypothetical protein
MGRISVDFMEDVTSLVQPEISARKYRGKEKHLSRPVPQFFRG